MNAGRLRRFSLAAAEEACLSYTYLSCHGRLGIPAYQLHKRSTHTCSGLTQAGCQGPGSATVVLDGTGWGVSPSWHVNPACPAGSRAFSNIAARNCKWSSVATSSLQQTALCASGCNRALSHTAGSDARHRLGDSAVSGNSNGKTGIIAAAGIGTQPRIMERQQSCLHTSSVVADSVKRKRGTKMKRHKWKKRMRLLRRKTKASRGGRA